MTGRTLFFADSEPSLRVAKGFLDTPRSPASQDFPRRLDLYRTFMQAMRVRAAARAHQGKTVLVVVGWFHKGEIESVLGDDPNISIVQPSAYGVPTATQADAQLDDADLAAILSFNLLGVQSSVGPVNWRWISAVLARFARQEPQSAELRLLRERYEVLTSRTSPATAAAVYERIAAETDSLIRFTFTGVEDTRRIDSYYDPFGNLRVRQRALVEAVREWALAGRADRVEQIRSEIVRGASWGPLAQGEFDVYWDRYIKPVAGNRSAERSAPFN